jgi:hypothetical protein
MTISFVCPRFSARNDGGSLLRLFSGVSGPRARLSGQAGTSDTSYHTVIIGGKAELRDLPMVLISQHDAWMSCLCSHSARPAGRLNAMPGSAIRGG